MVAQAESPRTALRQEGGATRLYLTCVLAGARYLVPASAVREALAQKGWAQADLPSERTLTNILNRQDYRLRTVAKSKVQKKRSKPMPSSPTSGESTTGPMPMHTP